MSGQSSETLTFLFTDIEGSTKRWERQPEAMARAVARHDEIMRAAISQHNGHVFKTVGDAFCAVFPNAEDAVAATVAAQRAIAEEPWGEVGPIRVRMGLHTGVAEERDNDYFGPTVNRVARIAASGHGGQMLLSSVTGEHVGERLPTGANVRSLGKHRLKDLARPERILQLIAAGLPNDFPRLKTVPSPTTGLVAAVLSTLVPLVWFRIDNRSSTEEVGASLFSPLSLYTGLKGLVIELSTLNEYVLLAVGLLFLLLAIGIAIARWRAVRRERQRRGDHDESRFGRWVINQRTVAFLGVLALLVLGAYAYQQYLWRVALPIPDDALGIAMTREASASVVREQLADSLYSQGQAEQIIIRELPVVFDARDTDKARELGDRIDAHAVIIYRTDEQVDENQRQYIAYVVFTDPSIGITITGAPDGTSTAGQAVVVKEGVPVPVLRTDTVEELVNAAAGIIAYDANQPRKAIEYLQLAVPKDPSAANTGIINFYLGNAYNLDNQSDLAVLAYENAAAFYEQRIGDGEILGPQDQLILAKSYMERGRAASFTGEWELALTWYDRAVALRSDVLARSDGLERPSDVHATYARLYTLMADAYRFMDLAEDQRSWEQRALDEIDALGGMTAPDDTYGVVQQSVAHVFIGDCVTARQVLDQALERDPIDIDALVNSGVIALLQDRPDLAREYWQRIIDAHPTDIKARELIAQTLTLSGLAEAYFEPAYLVEAEAYFREIIALDPTNVYAHQSLASLSSLRGQATTIDSTALVANDNLAVAKSQHAWPLDPDRRQAALDLNAEVIDEYRLIASELEPDSAEAAVSVAEAYVWRQALLYTSLIGPLLEGRENPESAELGEQILADAMQIHEWTDQVFSNPDATRLDLLRAWAARIESLEREWSWYALVQGDEARAAELENTHRQAIDEAVAFIESEPITSVDEIAPIRIVYFKAVLLEQIIDQDSEATAAYYAKIDDLTQEEFRVREEDQRHYSTLCTEKREQEAGDSLLAQGDVDGAKEHFEAALEANPEHIGALRGIGAAFYADGDIDGAIERVTEATQVAPDTPEIWLDLVKYQLVNGDGAAARASLDRFMKLVTQLPAQERMHEVGLAIETLGVVIDERPERVPQVIEAVSQLGRFLDDMPPEDVASYQYPTLYAELGELTLFADRAAVAEPLLRRSVELDPHQPVTHAHLVIAVLAQDKDATADMERAFDEVRSSFWPNVLDYEDQDQWLTTMEREASRFVDRYPERAAAIEPFTSAIPEQRERIGQSALGIDGNAYTSAGHGYSLSWDAPWTVNETSTDAATGIDSLQLGNGTSTIQLSTATAGEDPAGCLGAVFDALEGDPLWSTVIPAQGPDGRDLSGSNRGMAYAAFLDQPEEGVAAASLYYIECRALPAPGSLILIFIIVPTTQYEQQVSGVNEVLSTFSLPEGSDADLLAVDPIALPEFELESAGVERTLAAHAALLEAIVGAMPGDNGVATPEPVASRHHRRDSVML